VNAFASGPQLILPLGFSLDRVDVMVQDMPSATLGDAVDVLVR
jgi:hypothetical protein